METPNTSQTGPENGDSCHRCGKCCCGGKKNSEAAPHGNSEVPSEASSTESVPASLQQAVK